MTTLDAVKVAQRFKDEDMPGGWMLVNDDYGCGYSDNTESEQVDGTWWGKRDIPALKQTGDELRSATSRWVCGRSPRWTGSRPRSARPASGYASWTSPGSARATATH